MRRPCVRRRLNRPVAWSELHNTQNVQTMGITMAMSATPLSAWDARRLAAAKEPSVESAGISELCQRRGALSGPKRKQETEQICPVA